MDDKYFNSVSVGGNINHFEEGLFISFYNEDEDGNETDTVSVRLKMDEVRGLHFMLDSYLKEYEEKERRK